MDFLYITFPESGITTWLWLPPLVAFCISFFTSMGGVSGAFMLLPFQMSILNYSAPSVSGTNQLFNIVAIPGGVWRYIKEQRMLWPLTWTTIIGTLPGVFIGAWIRLEYLPEPEHFKLFAGCILLYIGGKLIIDTLKTGKTSLPLAKKANTAEFILSELKFSLKKVTFRFDGEDYSFSVPGVLLLCFIVGCIGGVYGIGGGAIIAPFFVAFFKLPIYAVAGAALMGTMITSIAGVIIYQVMAPYYSAMSVAPDWLLGLLFGIGGFCGMYLGARCQKYMPVHIIKWILSFCILFVGLRYTIFVFL